MALRETGVMALCRSAVGARGRQADEKPVVEIKLEKTSGLRRSVS